MEPYRLPKKDLENWSEWLTSGKFEQGSSCLYNSDTFCCLGVYGYMKGVPKKDLRDIPTLVALSHEDDSREYNNLIPLELLRDQDYSLDTILALLNDGVTIERLIPILYQNPQIDIGIENIEELDPTYEIQFNFEQIANFIKRNVEPY